MNSPQFSVHLEQSRENYGKFVMEPLPEGFGHTLGNALRRVLYSSIPGAAITSVSVNGVNHQFATLDGVKEDVVQLVLALKQIHLSYSGDQPVRISLSAKGQGEVKASQFELPSDVKIANPELVIAHLAEKSSKLEMEATVESGLGYSPAEDHKSSVLGVIPIDAAFTPVLRVNYSVEATRVGRMTNFDKLIIEIITDGTVTCQSALQLATTTLINYFSAILNPNPQPANSETSVSQTTSGSGLSIEELDLPTRISNALQKAGIESVNDLLSHPALELAKVKNLGTKSVKIIEVALKERGLELAQ
jgi:DNA-directed RNA polymerase subunit alpha